MEKNLLGGIYYERISDTPLRQRGQEPSRVRVYSMGSNTATRSAGNQ